MGVARPAHHFGRGHLDLLAVRCGDVDVLQPPHWLADVYLHACRLGAELGHHVFDTLYHATALEHPSVTLITADTRYFRKARGRGRIELLADTHLLSA